MKKKYFVPSLCVVELDTRDIVTDSLTGGGDNDQPDTPIEAGAKRRGTSIWGDE